MLSIAGNLQTYDWGSTTAIPNFIHASPDGRPWAEMWFGAHDAAPSNILYGLDGCGGEFADLAAAIASSPRTMLGDRVVDEFGHMLPFLVKFIAPKSPLSLQVHPNLEQARRGFSMEQANGLPPGSKDRNYSDANHKPELLYALTPFRALCGFRPVAHVLRDIQQLDSLLSREIRAILEVNPNELGLREVFEHLLSSDDTSLSQRVLEVAAECQQKLDDKEVTSSSSYLNVVALSKSYPGDIGVLSPLILNSISLNPGEALFVTPGTLHAYLEGLGVEIMANSNNVLRAGLTNKRKDPSELLRCVRYSFKGNNVLQPDTLNSSVSVFSPPVRDFSLMVITCNSTSTSIKLPSGLGPRIVLCVDGVCSVTAANFNRHVSRGQALFIPDSDGEVTVTGHGRLIQGSLSLINFYN